jgi:hypothetical protein
MNMLIMEETNASSIRIKGFIKRNTNPEQLQGAQYSSFLSNTTKHIQFAAHDSIRWQQNYRHLSP